MARTNEGADVALETESEEGLTPFRFKPPTHTDAVDNALRQR